MMENKIAELDRRRFNYDHVIPERRTGEKSYDVYHKINSDFITADTKFFESLYVKVAVIRFNMFSYDHRGKVTPDLSQCLVHIFRYTNSIDKEWWQENPIGIEIDPCFNGEGCRSTSVGDVIIDNETGIIRSVCGVGFKEIPRAGDADRAYQIRWVYESGDSVTIDGDSMLNNQIPQLMSFIKNFDPKAIDVILKDGKVKLEIKKI